MPLLKPVMWRAEVLVVVGVGVVIGEGGKGVTIGVDGEADGQGLEEEPGLPEGEALLEARAPPLALRRLRESGSSSMSRSSSSSSWMFVAASLAICSAREAIWG